MLETELLTEADLAALAKRFRTAAGRSRAEAGRDLGVSHVSIYRAEESPKESLHKLRLRIIEAYSPFTLAGPVFYLKPRS